MSKKQIAEENRKKIAEHEAEKVLLLKKEETLKENISTAEKDISKASESIGTSKKELDRISPRLLEVEASIKKVEDIMSSKIKILDELRSAQELQAKVVTILAASIELSGVLEAEKEKIKLLQDTANQFLKALEGSITDAGQGAIKCREELPPFLDEKYKIINHQKSLTDNISKLEKVCVTKNEEIEGYKAELEKLSDEISKTEYLIIGAKESQQAFDYEVAQEEQENAKKLLDSSKEPTEESTGLTTTTESTTPASTTTSTSTTSTTTTTTTTSTTTETTTDQDTTSTDLHSTDLHSSQSDLPEDPTTDLSGATTDSSGCQAHSFF